MKRRSKKQPKTQAPSLVARRLKEGLFIALCALAVFLCVAIATHNNADPGWSRATTASTVINAAGAIGAWWADLLLNFFGYMAYVFPLLATLAGILLFKSYALQSRSGVLWFLHLSGLALVVVSGCGLITLCSAGGTQNGGIIGSILSNTFVPRLSITGSMLMFLSMFMIGVTIGSGISWLRIMEFIGKGTLFGAQHSWTGGKKLWHACFGEDNAPRLAHIHEPALPMPPTRIEPEFKPREKIINKIEIAPPPKRVLLPRRSINQDSKLPDLELLQPAPPSDPKKHFSKNALENLSREVEQRLLDFGIEVKVVAVCPGPIITRFEMTLAPGIKVSKITGLAKDLARSLSVTSVRVVEVIPGKAVVGLEIPNQYREIVKLRDVLESSQFQDNPEHLNLALGKDIAGTPIVVNLNRMPHLLVAGTTGSGKSVGVNAMLLSLLFKSTPTDLRLILIDPKMLELSVYDGIGHLLTPVVTDMNDAANALRWCVAEMERRYQLMAGVGVRNLAGFNEKAAREPNAKLEKLPYIVVIIDEFADMMMVVGKKVEELIARIAQKARAAGIHLLLATQRPSVDVITGLIKANIPTRIAFQVSSRIDSRTILDQQGAEQLLGHGDMLYLAPGTGVPIRVHGAFVSDEEVHAVVRAIKQNTPPPEYIEEIAVGTGLAVPGIDPIDESGEQDPLYDEAVAIVTETRKASISYLQRRLKIGYNRSARLIEAMEAAGLVSAVLSNGVREVLV